MAGEKCSEVLECQVSEERMWCGTVSDAHNCLPKALPHSIASVEYGPGVHGPELRGFRTINFHKGHSFFDHVEKEIEKPLFEAKEKVKELGKHLALEEKKVMEELAHEEEKAKHLLEEEKKKIKEPLINEEDKQKKVLEHVKEKEKEVLAHAKEEEKFFHHEVLHIKEKIEEIDHEAKKFTAIVIEGGLLGLLFKHYKYLFQIKKKESGIGCLVHWFLEYEACTSKHAHPEEEIKKHFKTIFKSVEDYLLKHEDYAH